MYTLLRNGCPAPACRRCKRFADDPRGMHTDSCRFAPKGEARAEHKWGTGSPSDDLWVKHVITEPGYRPTLFEGHRLKNTLLVVWRFLPSSEHSYRVSLMVPNHYGHCREASRGGLTFKDAQAFAIQYKDANPDGAYYKEVPNVQTTT